MKNIKSSFKSKGLLASTLLTSIIFTSCGDDSPNSENTQTTTDTLTQTVSQTDTGTNSNTESNTTSETNTDTMLETDPDVIQAQVNAKLDDYRIRLSEEDELIIENKLSEEVEMIDNLQVETIVYQCQVSGTLTTVSNSDGTVISTTDQCFNEVGEITIDLRGNSDTGEITYTFTVGTAQGDWSFFIDFTTGFETRHMSVEDELGAIYSINQNEHGVLFIANGSTAEITQLPLQFVDNSRCEYEQYEQIIVNSNITTFSLLEHTNSCLADAAYTDLRSWSEAEATLIYEFEVSESNSFTANVTSQDLETNFETKIKFGDNVDYNQHFLDFDHQISAYLNIGTYTLEIQHIHSTGDIPDVFVQIDIANSTPVFIEEKSAPLILAQQTINDNGVYELTIEEAGEFYFNVNPITENIVIDVILTNSNGAPIDKMYFSEDGERSTQNLEAGTYYLYMNDVSGEMDFFIKSDTQLSIAFSQTNTAPELVTDFTPHSAILNTEYTVSDYTVEIGQMNYQSVVDIVQQNNGQNEDLLNSLTQGVSVSETIIDGLIETDITTYNCEVSGNIKYTYTSENNSSGKYEFETDNCIQNSGAVSYYYEYNYENYRAQEYFSYVQENGLRITVDKKDSFTYDLNDEMYIDLEGFGEIFVRYTSSNEANYFGANGTFLYVDYPEELLVDNKICHKQIVSSYNLNGVIFDEIVGEQNDCVTDFDFEETKSWTQTGSMLEYELTVTQDGTDFSAFFGTTEEDSRLDVALINENGDKLFSNNYGVDIIKQSQVLDAGTYKLLIKNTYTNTQTIRSDVYFQVKAENSSLSFIKENFTPVTEVASLLDIEFVQFESQTFEVEVIAEAYFSIDLIADDYLSVQMYDGNTQMNSVSGFEGAKLTELLSVGVYTIIVTSYNSDEHTVDLVVKSETENSATISEVNSEN